MGATAGASPAVAAMGSRVITVLIGSNLAGSGDGATTPPRWLRRWLRWLKGQAGGGDQGGGGGVGAGDGGVAAADAHVHLARRQLDGRHVGSEVGGRLE